MVNTDPLFADAVANDFSLLAGSPAIGTGLSVSAPESDFTGANFSTPRSRGAVESGTSGAIEVIETIALFPNPFSDELIVDIPNPADQSVSLYDVNGRCVWQGKLAGTRMKTGNLSPGMYVVRGQDERSGKKWQARVVKK